MSRSKIVGDFPHLQKAQFSITSSETITYNCIAWAAGDDTRWWWPTPPRYYWPSSVPRREDLASFLQAFATLGYAPTKDGANEKGIEKVAIYCDAQGVPKHAARQLENGTWTSKIGTWEDIRHTLFGLEGATYGQVVEYLARKRT